VGTPLTPEVSAVVGLHIILSSLFTSFNILGIIIKYSK